MAQATAATTTAATPPPFSQEATKDDSQSQSRQQHQKHQKDSYVGPHTSFEYQRLQRQHVLIKHALGDALILPPLPLDTADIHILDSATADGFFLTDLVASYPALAANSTAQLYGTDLRPAHFPPADRLPPRTIMLAQDITAPWPAELAGRFDLVNQRFVLANVPPEKAAGAVAGLWELVRPGGWLQLVEGDMYDVLLDGERDGDGKGEGEGEGHRRHEAMRKMVEVTRMLGHAADPGPRLEGWVRQIPDVQRWGLQVHAKTVTTWFGKMGRDMGDDPRLAELGTENIVDIVESIGAVSGNFPAMAGVDFAALKTDVKRELESVGNRWKSYAVWVQKPKRQAGWMIS